jgi:primosomal replication protein N
VNRLTLSATVAQVDPLRYTPAGVPAVNLVLEHRSDVLEMGLPRQIHMTVRAVAFGPLAETLSRQALDTAMSFDGFLASARNGKGVVFHIQDSRTP